MGVDKSYGSGYKNTGKADPTSGLKKGKRKASAAERSRAKDLKSGALGRPAGSSPFNDLKGRAIPMDKLLGIAATAALAGAGIAGLRGVRASVIKRNAAERTSIMDSKVNAIKAGRNMAAMSTTRPLGAQDTVAGRAALKRLQNFKDLDALKAPKFKKSTLAQMKKAIDYKNKVGR